MAATPRPMPLWRRVLSKRPAKIVLAVLLTLFLFEVVARVATAITLGPNVLLYGTNWARGTSEHQTWDQAAEIQDVAVVEHGAGAASYTKYTPSWTKKMPLVGGEEGTARINNHGFRGDDFTLEKPPGTLRVVVLGASSTFGYFDRDEETYPAYLEDELREALAEQPLGGFTSVEVLNFGIPHLESDQIRALFEAEALGVDPDVVTFYEGVNDTRRLERQASERAFNWVASKLLLVRWVQLTLWDRLESFDRSDLVHHLEDKAKFFVGNIEAMAEACSERDILFVAMSQQATSKTLTRDQLKLTSYAEEETIIRARLDETGRLSGLELVFLIHCELNRGLKAWAEAYHQPFVDVVALFDELKQRHHLVSWVHMSPHGNRLIAEALADEILRNLRAD